MIPWWGWLLISLGSAYALYWIIVVIFIGIVWAFIMKRFDD